MDTKKRLLSINEVSEYLGIKKNTIYTWVSQRKLPYVKCGSLVRFDIIDINKWIEENKIEKNVNKFC